MNAPQLLTPAQQDLVLQARPSVEMLAEKLARIRRSLPIEDVTQLVWEGFVEAARLYDPAHGPFAVFAWKRAVGNVNRAAMREARHAALRNVRDAVATMDVSDDDYDFYDENDDPQIRLEVACRDGAFRMFFGATFEAWRTEGEQGTVNHLTRLQAFGALRAAFATLEADEWSLLEQHYIDLRTWEEIGASFGIGERQARRRHDDAREKLRVELAAHGVEEAPPSGGP